MCSSAIISQKMKILTRTFQQSYDAAEFEALAAKYMTLKWRMISKPGGATVKPDDFYNLYG